MARGDEQELRCRNSSDERPRTPEELQRPRLPEPRPRNRWQSPARAQSSAWTSSSPATPEPPALIFNNPSLMPAHTRRSSSRVNKEVGEQLLQIWHRSLDDLIRRTEHDYDLVVNYERDAEGGLRWLPEDVASIRAIGKRLHHKVFDLKRQQRVVADLGDQDQNMMIQIKRAAILVKLHCEDVQVAINRCEQKHEFELSRDGKYRQDEDSNIYRPIEPQHYAADDDSQTFKQPSRDHAEDHHQRRMIHIDEVTLMADAHFRKYPQYSMEYSSSQRRDVPFPSFSTAATNDSNARPRSETARQPESSRPDKVLGGRISKPASSAGKHRSPPSDHTDIPDTTALSAQVKSDKRPRGRGSNRDDRDGHSRRQAKRDRKQNQKIPPSQIVGKMGNHWLHL